MNIELLVVGALPPPLSGQALAGKQLVDELQEIGWSIETVDTGRPISGYPSVARALLRVAINGLKICRASLSIRRRGPAVCLLQLAHGSRGLVRDALYLLLIRGLGAMPVAVHVHGRLTAADIDVLPGIGRLLVRRELSRVEIVIALTPILARELRELWPTGASSNPRFLTLGNKVRTDFDTLTEPLPDTGDGLRLVHVGGLCHTKGTDLALEISQLPEVAHLDLVGPIACERIRSELSHACPDDVTWWGELAATSVRERLDAAHALVHPSASEGQPIVLLEAMARARVVLATSVGGIVDVIGPGDFQVLKSRSAAEISRKVKRLGKDRNLIEGLANQNRVRFEQLMAHRNIEVLSFSKEMESILGATQGRLP